MYKGVFKIYRTYWSAYGGLDALVRSLYLLAAVILLVFTYPTWGRPFFLSQPLDPAWWDQSISVLPNLLGFTLGGFAIFIGFGDEKFRAALAAPPDENCEAEKDLASVYVSLCATFVHFILVQMLALIIAVLAKTWWFYAPWMEPLRLQLPYLNAVGGAVGYGLYLYALMTVLAATMHVFRISTMYATFQKVMSKP